MSPDNSTPKFDITFFRKDDGSKWMRVELLKYGARRPTLVPSFLDLWRIIQAIAECEDESYPPPRYKGRGRLAEFLHDAVHEKDFRVLAQRYQIPERDRDRVVKTNGADVKLDGPDKPNDAPMTADDINWGDRIPLITPRDKKSA